LSCTLNPEVGFEERGMPHEKSGIKDIHFSKPAQGPAGKIQKRVLVIGAGPAGLEAAKAARERGHDVTLYEREKDVGGQINLAKMGAGRELLSEAIRYYVLLLKKRQVPIITGVDVTPEMVLGLNPDAVIVATGSKPRSKPVPGDYSPPLVLNVWEILQGQYPVGQRILYIDENGGHRAAATAERLADQGKKVDMITSELFIGIDLAPIGDLYLSRQRLLQKGVTFTCDIRIDSIDGHRVRGRHIYTNDPLVYENYDTVVLDMGNEVEDRLYKQLKGKVKEIRRVGDCVAPRNIPLAVFEGWRAGAAL
ncbi:MAG: FAD-dependent oxidoreductase, partial [Deltaproteobacteria bacterium]|nr:FAD-dependent oxidoreductase [Deltaproteobacteria bacterium]